MVEGDGFEIRCTVLRYRGFESLSLRYGAQSKAGEVSEWSKVHPWKGCGLSQAPGVRIPPSPFPLGVDGRFCTIASRPTPSGPEGSSGKRFGDELQAMYRSQGGFSS